ncbi:MAG: Ig-like domain-containing protein, partial [Angustibacter sp.]
SVLLRDPADGTFKQSFSIVGEGLYAAQPDGRVLFTPTKTFVGTGTELTYRVADKAGIEATATLEISVTRVTPTATDDSAKTPEGIAVPIPVLANDTVGDSAITFDPGTLELFDVDNGVFGPVVVVPGEGRYAVNGSGQVVFTPEPGFAGITVPLRYQVADTNGTIVSAKLKVEVTNPNAPNLVPKTASTPRNVPIEVPLLDNSSPGAGTFVIGSIRLQNPATGAFATSVTIPGEGIYSVLATGEVRFVPDPAFVGTAQAITYRVENSGGLSATSTLTIDVTAANVAPTAKNDTATTPQGKVVVIKVAANDVAGNSALDLDSILLKDPVTGLFVDVVTVPTVGEYRVDYAADEVKFTPDPTFTGPAPIIRYRISDVNSLSDKATIAVTVTAITPTAVDDDATTFFGTAVPVPVLDNDDPGAPSTPLVRSTLTIKDPADGTFKPDVVIPGRGRYQVNASQEIVFTPESGVSGPIAPVEYRIADANGTYATANLSIIVANPGAPIAKPDKKTTLQGIPVDIPVTANDAVGNAPLDLATLKFLGGTSTSPTNTTVPNVGTWSVTAPGVVTFTPVPGFTGATPPLKYEIADDNGQTATANITVTVTAVQPSTNPDTASTQMDKPVDVNVLSNDVAGNAAIALDPKTVSLRQSNGSFAATLTIAGEGVYTADANTGVITFAPASGFSGPATPVTYRVLDANGTPGTNTLTVTVAKPPQLSPDNLVTIQGVPLVFNPQSNDLPGDAPLAPATMKLIDPISGLPVTKVDIPGEGTYELTDALGNVTFTPLPTYAGPGTQLKYTLADTAGLVSEGSLRVRVTAVTPTATPDSLSTRQGVPVQIRAFSNDLAGDPAVPLI